MKNIDIKELKEIKEELECMDEQIFICENKEPKYVIVPIDEYDDLASCKELIDGKLDTMPNEGVKIITNSNSKLSYEEYEKIRKQLVDVFDATFKPKPEKLN